MLKRFEVSNFKQFKSIVLDFSNIRNYDFSTDCLIETSNGKLVKTALVYGENGSGKSNLGFALFDIVHHLVDKVKKPEIYTYYTNADSPNVPVHFSYTFLLDGTEIVYSYEKLSSIELLGESLSIDGREVFSWDHRSGTQNLQNLKDFGFRDLNFIYRDSNLSFLRYLANNSPLAENSPIRKLMDFVGSMLWFKSIDSDNSFMGLLPVYEDLGTFIIENDFTEAFESFLNDNGVYERIRVEMTPDGRKGLYFSHKQNLPFFATASSGTLALAVLFFWLKQIEIHKSSLIFMDDFDAFYPVDVARKIFNLSKKYDAQSLFTTHNTNLLTHAITRPDCCYFLNNGEIQPFQDLTDREIREGNNLEKIIFGQRIQQTRALCLGLNQNSLLKLHVPGEKEHAFPSPTTQKTACDKIFNPERKP